MNCGRCLLPVEEIAGLVYQCSHCKMIVDESRGVCIFSVGPFHITLFDDFGIHGPMMTRTQIVKGIKQLHLSAELPVNIDEETLQEIWKSNKED